MVRGQGWKDAKEAEKQDKATATQKAQWPLLPSLWKEIMSDWFWRIYYRIRGWLERYRPGDDGYIAYMDGDTYCIEDK